MYLLTFLARFFNDASTFPDSLLVPSLLVKKLVPLLIHRCLGILGRCGLILVEHFGYRSNASLVLRFREELNHSGEQASVSFVGKFYLPLAVAYRYGVVHIHYIQRAWQEQQP